MIFCLIEMLYNTSTANVVMFAAHGASLLNFVFVFVRLQLVQ